MDLLPEAPRAADNVSAEIADVGRRLSGFMSAGNGSLTLNDLAPHQAEIEAGIFLAARLDVEALLSNRRNWLMGWWSST